MSGESDILMIEGTQLNQADEWAPMLIYRVNGETAVPFFQSLLLAPPRINGRFLTGLCAGYNPARREEWKIWADSLFSRGQWLSCIHRTVVKYKLSPIDIWIMLPYPRFGQENFGEIDRRKLSFFNMEDRMHALRWWIAYVSGGFEKYVYGAWETKDAVPKIRLRGFVWGREAVSASDQPLVQSVNEYITSLQLESVWLTNYGAAQLSAWRELGFDHASVFSNYTGKTEYGIHYLNNAVNYALAYKTGLQIICGKGLRFDDSHFSHYLDQKKYFERNGGCGPLVYRFPNHSLSLIYKNHPYRYDQIFQSLNRRLTQKGGS
ncbi:DUF4855 domain-containing protein [Paenibacillus thermotolerans]|uniref:DUF4855 domain-containing protein n=1 Tax=Paenibacillus thermotolerans TaxID=3027807 RepID=UPI002368E8EA|nr:MULTISPECIES: DUF4855 domain-containing protein [unclassified Paenibacillus]